MKALNKDELDQVSGGLITTYRGNYWAVSDEGDAFWNHNSKNKQEMIDYCKRRGWSVEEISPEEFKKRFGYDFEPDWVRLEE